MGQHLLHSGPSYETPALHYWAREARNSNAAVIGQLPYRCADFSLDGDTVIPESEVQVVETVALAVVGEVLHVNRIQVEEEC